MVTNAFFSLYDPAAGPGREQNLFIGISKHIYRLKSGALKYQSKALDPRIPGKDLITRFVLLDVDTGTVYGECHGPETCKDLVGFLARAWSKKHDHPMRGIPATLNVPKLVWKDDEYARDITLIREAAGTGDMYIGDLPSGFAAGVHAVRQFEKAVASLFWRVKDSSKADLLLAQICSAILSAEASDSFAGSWKAKWDAVAPPPSEFFEAIDGYYKPPGAWRLPPFDIVLNGLPVPD